MDTLTSQDRSRARRGWRVRTGRGCVFASIVGAVLPSARTFTILEYAGCRGGPNPGHAQVVAECDARFVTVWSIAWAWRNIPVPSTGTIVPDEQRHHSPEAAAGTAKRVNHGCRCETSMAPRVERRREISHNQHNDPYPYPCPSTKYCTEKKSMRQSKNPKRDHSFTRFWRNSRRVTTTKSGLM